MTDFPHPLSESDASRSFPRCEPQIEDELVIREEVAAFIKSAGADLQALHAAIVRFVVHCRDRGEAIERIIVTLKDIIAGAVRGDVDIRAVNAINGHLLGWVLDAYYTRER
ncbi:MAG TPA: hypothetical protein VJ650_00825 [Gemmatimonadaceae bacterium]|nr:hypothetical protein [Gemmatimonadaceae bacterium]